MHTKDAQEVRAAQEVQPPAPLDPTPGASEPLVHTRLAHEVAAAQEVQPQPGPPSPAPAQVDEMALTRTPAGYGNTQGKAHAAENQWFGGNHKAVFTLKNR